MLKRAIILPALLFLLPLSLNAISLGQAINLAILNKSDQSMQTIELTISVSKKYYNYFLTYNNFQLLSNLQKKINERNKNMDSLIQAGLRSKNDLLAMQVYALENQRKTDNAEVQYLNAKYELMKEIGVYDEKLVTPPEKQAFSSTLEDLRPVEQLNLDPQDTAKITYVKNLAARIAIYKKSVQKADELLDLQKKLYENEQKRFNAGLITVDDLLAQDEKYIAAENSYYQVLVNYLISVLEYKNY
jgi:outer membrane protein TolC